MSEALSSTEIDRQHIELLPARTVMSMGMTARATSAGEGGGGDGGAGDGGGGGKGTIPGGSGKGIMGMVDSLLAATPAKDFLPK